MSCRCSEIAEPRIPCMAAPTAVSSTSPRRTSSRTRRTFSFTAPIAVRGACPCRSAAILSSAERTNASGATDRGGTRSAARISRVDAILSEHRSQPASRWRRTCSAAGAPADSQYFEQVLVARMPVHGSPLQEGGVLSVSAAPGEIYMREVDLGAVLIQPSNRSNPVPRRRGASSPGSGPGSGRCCPPASPSRREISP